MSLQPVIRNYLLICRIEGLPAFAVNLYRQTLEDFAETHPDISVSDLNPAHVNRYVTALDKAESRRARGILRMFIHWLIAQNKMRFTPPQPHRVSQVFLDTAKVRRSWVV